MKQTIGIIVRISGKSLLLSNGKSGETLTNDSGAYVVIHKFDQIIVKTGEVLLSMADGTKRTLTASSRPYVLKGVGLPTITEQFRRGGLSRGNNDGRIVHPMSNERMTVNNFSVHWNVQPSIKSFTLVKIGKSEGIAFTAETLSQTTVTQADLHTLREYVTLNGTGRYQISGKAGDSFQSFEFDVVTEAEVKALENKLTKFSPQTPDGLLMRAHIYAAEKFYQLALDNIKQARDQSPKSVHLSKLFLEVMNATGDEILGKHSDKLKK